MVVCVGHVGIC